MNSKLLILTLLIIVSTGSEAAQYKPRFVVLTDISTLDTDDHESLIRLLVHGDLFEIEGIIITTGWSLKDVNEARQFMDFATGAINAYESDLLNLMNRSNCDY